MSSLSPISKSEMVTNGSDPMMNGMRLPQRVRNRSLHMLIGGVMVKLNRAGRLVIIMLMYVSEAPRLRKCSGTMLGTTDSIIVKQKSPQSIHANIITSPRFV